MALLLVVELFLWLWLAVLRFAGAVEIRRSLTSQTEFLL